MSIPYEHPFLASAKDPSGPIIVIGMHRSGTTLLARILSELGVHMGKRTERNHESTCFLRANDSMLRSAGASWLNPQPFTRRLSDPAFVRRMCSLACHELDARIDDYGAVASGQRWGWKDPRTTLTLPVWLRLFPDAKVVHIIRNGIDVALSLRRRAWRHFLRPRHNDTERLAPIMALIRGYRLWEFYVHQARDLHVGTATTIHQLRYERLIKTPSDELIGALDFIEYPQAQAKVVTISENLLRSPTKPSAFELWQIRVLSSFGVIEVSTLAKLGYAGNGTALATTERGASRGTAKPK